MSDETGCAGGCLCGAVRFTAIPKVNEVGVCHCDMCRRWSGGVLMVVDCQDDVDFEKDDDLGIYRSSEWGERGFCRKCGTSLFWKTHGKGRYAISVAAFDDPGPMNFVDEIFIDEKPDFYAFANDTHKMTGREVFAKFAQENKNA